VSHALENTDYLTPVGDIKGPISGDYTYITCLVEGERALMELAYIMVKDVSGALAI